MRITNSSAARAPWLALAFVFLICSSSATAQSNQPPADNTYIEGAVLWQQSSGERRALSYQAFALARMVLDQDLRMNRRPRKPRAIIVDLDETILDTSPYEGTLLKDRVNYPEGWTEWINRAEAAAVPGAVEFLNYAAARGVTVFYITNRNEAQRAGTAANLKKLGFPKVSDQTLLVQTDPKVSSKEPRRQSVGAEYRIVLLMGDDLNDFAKVFEDSRTVESRMAASDRFKNEFGKRFIVLPNAMYGNWEQAIYEYNKLSEAEKAARRKNQLKSN
ncbi:MAG TPA: 5'-nucleotidase, lipoprotein e(P4) family [Pyrinomonadaceae bacterium]|nr:5'-nucleotidase, lipoprotein e(P4) family [Pyrinomonadaceae bacterium]